ncbi:MAG: aspartate--tRNA ligase [Candidatus Liptonbacteria bacterium]|nr:aspartate--tRNA ligase [Candidatus Liptonbacteria bacterium]
MRILSNEIASHEGKEVVLAGWVGARRDHGKLIFIDLRDRRGLAQLVFTPEKKTYAEADKLRPEWVIQVKGEVRRRPKGMENPALPSGNFEVSVAEIEVLNHAITPPFPLESDGYDIDESIRLKYRYLDLRRPRLSRNLKIRHQVSQFIRKYLGDRDFVEVETPILTKSTPEGARDFIVPSRLQPGKFYALPQSPQQYKQLLMVAGFERYFQLARALRDEDLRADRGFEHTQLDLEMSFVGEKDVMELIEGLMTALFEDFGKKIYKKPFPVIDYKEAIKKFGADKFDLRAKKNLEEVALAWVINFPVFVRDEKTKELTYSHNPFTAPRGEDIPKLLAHKDLENLVSLQYDLVCNGFEIGGGGIRINKAEVLEKVFKILGHSKDKIQKQFGHMLEAFRFGAPPHGGIALGLDRILMILAGEEYLREVVAFPTTGGGETSVMDAPSEVDKSQLDELHLKIKK